MKTLESSITKNNIKSILSPKLEKLGPIERILLLYKGKSDAKSEYIQQHQFIQKEKDRFFSFAYKKLAIYNIFAEEKIAGCLFDIEELRSIKKMLKNIKEPSIPDNEHLTVRFKGEGKLTEEQVINRRKRKYAEAANSLNSRRSFLVARIDEKTEHLLSTYSLLNEELISTSLVVEQMRARTKFRIETYYYGAKCTCPKDIDLKNVCDDFKSLDNIKKFIQEELSE